MRNRPQDATTLIDLHNHSCLSPCASLEMSPSLLARRAGDRGIGVLGLTDHNAALNCPAFAEACRAENIVPVFGMEACSLEEVHVLCLFGSLDEALAFGSFLRTRLPSLPYDPLRLGDQVVVDVRDNILDQPRQYFGAALQLGFEELCRAAAAAGALVIPAHVDRAYFSISSQLGFLPPGPYDAVEALAPIPVALARGLPVISGSDAHYPEDIGMRPFRAKLPPLAFRGEAANVFAALRDLFRGGLVESRWEQGN